MMTASQRDLKQVQIRVRNHIHRLLPRWQIGSGTDLLASPGAKENLVMFVTVAIPEIFVKAKTDIEAVTVTASATGQETGLMTEMATKSKATAVTGKDTSAEVIAATEALNVHHSAQETVTAPGHRAMTVIMIGPLGIGIANMKERVETRDTNQGEMTEGTTGKTIIVIPVPRVRTRTDPLANTADLIDKTEIVIDTTDAEAVKIEMKTRTETRPPDIQSRILSPLPGSDHWTLSGSMS